MIPSRRRLLLGVALAAALFGARLSRGAAHPAAHPAARRRDPRRDERSYGLIEDIDERQLQEFVAQAPGAEGPNCRARPG